jgi:hypothetical protein
VGNPFQKMEHLYIPEKLKKGSYVEEIAVATEIDEFEV